MLASYLPRCYLLYNSLHSTKHVDKSLALVSVFVGITFGNRSDYSELFFVSVVDVEKDAIY
jgi:hypothetical protein